ncbi:hypothetical protein [Bartonella sp. DGB2]|uniref:hypothetical protein n=1 Tax=Bartonella sp. DGB2 TaxID=3388426 RepID=UPI00398FB59A
MVDFTSLLRKTIEAQTSRDADVRARIYERALTVVVQKLEQRGASSEQIEEQKEALKAAIVTLEDEYTERVVPSDSEGMYTALWGQPAAPLGGNLSTEGFLAVPVPAAEPVNMDDLLEEGSKMTFDPPLSSESYITGKDIISSIFSEAARRQKWRALKKHLVMAGAMIWGLIVFFGLVFAGAWHFLVKTSPADVDTPLSVQAAKTKEEAEKLTFRLLPDGREENVGLPADVSFENRSAISGQGDSKLEAVARLPQAEAVLYHPRHADESEQVETGKVKWTLVVDGVADKGKEVMEGNRSIKAAGAMALHGDVFIPTANMHMQMILRRNDESNIPAAYIIDFIFSGDENSDASVITSLPDLRFKANEQAVGQSLAGAVGAKVKDNLFIFALNNMQPFLEKNLELIRRSGNIALQIVDRSGKESELSFDKGSAGAQLFNQLIDSWLEDTASASTPASKG